MTSLNLGERSWQQWPKRQKVLAGHHSGYQGRLTILVRKLESRLDRSQKVYVGNGPQTAFSAVDQTEKNRSNVMYTMCTTSWARRNHGGLGKGHHRRTVVGVCLPTLQGLFVYPDGAVLESQHSIPVPL